MFAVLPALLLAVALPTFAQQSPEPPPPPPDAMERMERPAMPGQKETQEIVIRKKGDKDVNLTLQLTGDQVLINGKPLIEFKNDEITVNNRKIIIRDRDRHEFNDLMKDFQLSFDNIDKTKIFTSKRTYLGITMEDGTDGVKINSLVKDGPAEKAGLEVNDIITKVDGTVITGSSQLSTIIADRKPGEVKVSYKRGKKEKSLKVYLQERTEAGANFSYRTPSGNYKTFNIPRPPNPPTPPMPPAGFGFDQFNDDHENFDVEAIFGNRRKLGLKIQDTEDETGVKVLEVEDSSAAAIAGLKKDDIITEIGNAKVSNTDEARSELGENAEKSAYPIKARRNGTEITFNIKIPKKLKTANL